MDIGLEYDPREAVQLTTVHESGVVLLVTGSLSTQRTAYPEPERGIDTTLTDSETISLCSVWTLTRPGPVVTAVTLLSTLASKRVTAPVTSPGRRHRAAPGVPGEAWTPNRTTPKI
uniref:Uncharacterized protein n=1 Tax=Cacopsylla melanoneura TaxID=428564 RepID=A0A8D8R6Y0_9HEMI